MKERPIIFNSESVKSILGDRKTQTRRIRELKVINKNPDGWHIVEQKDNTYWFEWRYKQPNEHNVSGEVTVCKCPYGQVDDRLWVRETFSYWGNPVVLEKNKLLFKADNVQITTPRKWQPSIFMPRWASRITLEITDIRVERLQDITEEDAKAEGIEEPVYESTKTGYIYAPDGFRRAYSILWDSLNAKRGYGWEVNPFVWVISFRQIK